jgi:hypothetical protein
MPTRFISHTITSNNPCPISADYSKLHGPNPGSGTIVFRRDRSFLGSDPNPMANNFDAFNKVGDQLSIVCDQSEFFGFIYKIEVTTNDSDGKEILTVSFVDWRDRLHDFFIFGAFNILEESGKCWHLLPEDWKNQQRTVITHELDQFDFNDLQDENTFTGQIKAVGSKGLISSTTILNVLSAYFMFSWSANQNIKNLLDRSRPMNLDWQNGITAAQALEDVLSKTNMVWTIRGGNEIVIHQKGVAENLYFNQFLSGQKSMCELDGRFGSYGYELNDEGRYVLIIGERNKHQLIFPCRPDWNENFDFSLCYNGVDLSNLLIQHNLHPWSKLKELPGKYHDYSHWDGNQQDLFAAGAVDLQNMRTRNEMTIFEYVNNICFKVYRVDFNCTVDLAGYNQNAINSQSGSVSTIDKNTLKYHLPSEQDQYGNNLHYETELELYPFYEHHNFPLDPQRYDDFRNDPNNTGIDFPYNLDTPYTPSRTLVTDSNAQFVALTTSRRIVKGKDYPFEEQLHFTPTINGVSLEVVEKINTVNYKEENLVRLVFSTPQFILTDLTQWRDTDLCFPDKMLAMISLDKDIFTYTQGSQQGKKVRTQRTTVKNLYRAYENQQEVKVLARNFVNDLLKGGSLPAVQPANALDIAYKIAQQMLFNLNVSRSGNMVFNHKASHEPDSTIESINVSFSDSSGLSERINFSKHIVKEAMDELSSTVYRVSRILPTDSKVNRERLQSISEAVVKHARENNRSNASMDEMIGDYGVVSTLRYMENVMRGNSIDQDNLEVEGEFTP